MTTPYHARYFAHELTRLHGSAGVDRLSMALFDACVDLNPHQIEAALFALRSPLVKGVILADEVGLGKTIEAGLVLCQHWAEKKRRLLVICPASLRKQWSLELTEKFNLPNVVLDARTYRLAQAGGNPNPFDADRVLIASLNFASTMRADIRAVAFDLVVIDEAHKLRNAYRPSNRMGQNIKWAVEERRKLLLTATPLQNSLLELYGLSTVIDDMIFGDPASFRSQYATNGADLTALRDRLQPFCKRTLRRQVVEYIQYTERRPLTIRFRPTDDEQKLYEAVSEYLIREDTIALPRRQRHLTALILRKLLASSSHAIANTLETMKARLETLRPRFHDLGYANVAEVVRLQSAQLAEELVEEEEIEEDLLDEILAETGEDAEPTPETPVERKALDGEIAELTRFARWARSIGIDTKSRALLKALEVGFGRMAEMAANRKALVFTESRRTQDYLKNFLESNGYAGQVVLFNGTNAAPESRRIIDGWIDANAGAGRVTGSRAVDSRTALIEHFRDRAAVMIATEAAAEGINLQFCSLVINYDLPWNPQRIEQRIGRCHRYGQKHDVVVINFLNERNEADRRVHELLSEKFNLFSGVFGASDEVLGTIESGVDFERRILGIYQQCRTLGEIDAAFRQLQAEMEETIKTKLDDTRRVLMEHFDEDVHARLKMRLDDTRANLDRIGRMFWALTQFVLEDRAEFDDDTLTFELTRPPAETFKPGRYHLISKTQPNVPGEFCTAKGNQQPGLVGLFDGFRARTPQLYVHVDREKVKSMGVALSDVFDALQAYLGSFYVNDFNRFGRTWQVNVQAEPRFRTDAEAVKQLKVRNAGGDMVPLGTVAEMRESAGPVQITRYNMFPAATITGASLPDVSTGEVLATMERLADQELNKSMAYEWTELSYLQKQASKVEEFRDLRQYPLSAFVLGAVLVFFVLAGLYEGWSLPLAVILVVPMCLLCALAGVAARGLDNNLFTQIGFVVLVGLACKNAILIVEFARDRQQEGASRFDAAVDAARVRLRPIVMTTLCFIHMVPPYFASGAGAEMRRSVGTAMLWGAFGVTLFGIFLTPVFFYVIRRFVRGRTPIAEPAAVAAAGPSGRHGVATVVVSASSNGEPGT